MANAKGTVVLTPAQRDALERLVWAYTSPQHIAQRARIVLMSAQGLKNVTQARQLGIDTQRVRRWRRRWVDEQPAIQAAEDAGGVDAYIDDLVYAVLCDDQTSGRKPIFTAEQVAQIIAVACEKPSEASPRPSPSVSASSGSSSASSRPSPSSLRVDPELPRLRHVLESMPGHQHDPRPLGDVLCCGLVYADLRWNGV